MGRYIQAICLCFLASCSGGGVRQDPSASQVADPMPGPVAAMNASTDPMPGPVADPMPGPPPGPPPGGDRPGACRNVGVPQGSNCRLSGLRFQHCADCPSDWHRYRATYLVKVDGVDHGFNAGTFRVHGDQFEAFKAFMEKNSPVPCAGLIVNPPCNPSATHVKLELTWPAWLVRERD